MYVENRQNYAARLRRPTQGFWPTPLMQQPDGSPDPSFRRKPEPSCGGRSPVLMLRRALRTDG